MAGTSETSIWESSGEYRAFTNGEAASAITLGNVVELDTATADQVKICTDASTVPIGVAVAGQRVSRTVTDNTIPAGMKVTVCMRGVVNITSTAAAITIGGFVQGGGSGQVKALTVSASTDVNKIVGRALSTVSSAGGKSVV